MNIDDALVGKLKKLFGPPEKNPSTSYLIKAYGLEEIAVLPNFNFSKGLDWQKLRGTITSLLIAFEMLGAEVVSIEELNGDRWNYYTVRVRNIPNDLKYYPMLDLCRLSAPLRSRLYRFADVTKEVKSLRLSSKRGKTGKNLLSNYSGHKIDGIWICV